MGDYQPIGNSIELHELKNWVIPEKLPELAGKGYVRFNFPEKLLDFGWRLLITLVISVNF